VEEILVIGSLVAALFEQQESLQGGDLNMMASWK